MRRDGVPEQAVRGDPDGAQKGGQPTSVWGLDGAGKGHTTVNAFATSVCSLQLDIGLHFLDLNSIAPIAFGSI